MIMPSTAQLPLFLPIDAERQSIERYVTAMAPQYVKAARKITPDHGDPVQVWSRLAFAILSANTPFQDSVDALKYAMANRGKVTGQALAQFKCTPSKADYLNNLPDDKRVFVYLRQTDESWNTYRLRLKKNVAGLGLAKASFAAALLYPLEADVACLDTHMQTIYLGLKGFHTLSLATYHYVEAQLRELAQRARINTFLAQWLVWDYTRGIVSDHDIFPGAHKGA
jgi:thermostable 8-oxoguanine DNA glycosylase